MSQPDFVPYTPGQEKFGKAFIKNFGALQVFVYRLTGGRLMNTFLGVKVAILGHYGRKTGQLRRTPLLYLEDGTKVVLAASCGGFSRAPQWQYNLDANPMAEIQIGPVNRKMKARRASESEEALYWPRLTELYPGFNEYRARVEGVRHIPLYILEENVSEKGSVQGKLEESK
jgi:deazaflavin-dependent oxidoreductase (nitroreductase family)